MIDRDGIIRDLTNLRDDFKAAPDEESQAWAKTLGDALAMLKEQDSKIKSLEQTIEDICCG